MSKSKTRAQAGPVRPVELKQAWQRLVAQSVRAALNKSFADPSGIEALAFQGQKRQLIERVHQAKGAAEFKAIDDHWRIRKADMLGAQITMPLDNTAVLNSVFEYRRVLLETTPHAVKRVADLRSIQAEAWVREHHFGYGMLARKLLHIAQRRKVGWRTGAIKRDEEIRHSIDAAITAVALYAVLKDGLVEH